MPEYDYVSTSLWQKTLAARSRADDHRSQRERLRVSYMALRDTAAVLLSENARSLPDFTVHDISHVDALWETASLMCGDQVALNPAEAYVLGCAFVLHDAAMGAAAYGMSVPSAFGEQRWRDLVSVAYFQQHGCWPDQEKLDAPPAEIAEVCLATAIRETHAEQALRLVDQPWRSSTGNEIYLIQDLQLREAYGPLIGDLAASHWWPVHMLADRFRQAKGSLPWQPAEWIIEPLKLASILRLADAAQIDSRRAPTFLFALRKPQGIARQHWRFQEHVSRPHLHGDRITYTSLRPFSSDDAAAWWLALDYLRGIDEELKKVDALLHDLGRSRLAARAVAGVDSPERFAELFPVSDWRPIDAVVKVTDVPALVGTLGGEQLYGKELEVAVRELIQNAQDAVLARCALEPDFTDGRVDVRLTENSDSWCLEISDNGVGMDEEALVHGLLDFGTSGWSSTRVRSRLPGLASGGFQPNGRFGIGFFSVFLLGDQVELITRRYDASMSDARRLSFESSSRRPLLMPLPAQTRASLGTTVRVTLKENPYDAQGLFRRTSDDRLLQVIQRLVLENAVPIRIWEPDVVNPHVLAPFALATGAPDEVFDRLYPPLAESWQVGREEQRLRLRDHFVERAAELLDDSGRRIGLATIWNNLFSYAQGDLRGIVTVNGFRADDTMAFAGYLAGEPSRASRDKVNLVADREQVRRWMRAQEQWLRDSKHFGDLIQLDLAYTFYRTLGFLADDVAFAITTQGLLRPADISAWVEQRNEVFISWVPLSWRPSPPHIFHYVSGQDVQLPDHWVVIRQTGYVSPIYDMFPDILNRDSEYEHARHQRTLTWQKFWWRMSGDLFGLFLRGVCQGWSCTIEALLAPLEQRHWSDHYSMDEENLGPVSGYLLRRPGSSS
ncbi:HD domain-containing protein [Streptomyces yatensis]|uniref:Histidine kinase/HSP90-like ATPase domain-containing protein n=1 Tax=Streptomyces yatensis TaxID=155177 RepID=A0ABN2H8P6_9ACTN|nr:ATP-binding protein [Streptomyces yatensis]